MYIYTTFFKEPEAGRSFLQHKIRIDKLGKIAGGLNIEGPNPYKTFQKTNRNGIYVNVIVNLDRPLIDNVVFDEIYKLKAKHNYPLLENAILDLNENKFLTAYLSVSLYYIHYAYTVLKKPKNKITIHFHQDKNCVELIKIFDKLLKELRNICYLNNEHFKEHKITVEIEYRNDNNRHNVIDPDKYDEKTDIKTDQKIPETRDFHQLLNVNPNYNYGDTDILISLSQCAGLNSKHETGAIFVPYKFIQYDISKKTIYASKPEYIFNNLYDHNVLNKFGTGPFLHIVANYVNSVYKSANIDKKHKCPLLSSSDFIRTPILQVTELWNPVDRSELITVI